MIALSISTAREMSFSSIGRIATFAMCFRNLAMVGGDINLLRPPSAIVAGAPEEVKFPTASGAGEVRGIVQSPAIDPRAGLVLAHARSNDMKNSLLRRLAEAASDAGFLAVRFNFRYVDAKKTASRDLSLDEAHVRGAEPFVLAEAAEPGTVPGGPGRGPRLDGPNPPRTLTGPRFIESTRFAADHGARPRQDDCREPGQSVLRPLGPRPGPRLDAGDRADRR